MTAERRLLAVTVLCTAIAIVWAAAVAAGEEIRAPRLAEHTPAAAVAAEEAARPLGTRMAICRDRETRGCRILADDDTCAAGEDRIDIPAAGEAEALRRCREP